MKIIDLRIFKMIGLIREYKEPRFPKKPRQKRSIELKKKNVILNKELKKED
jgi:hypothetical protein